ncbi:hypothetical protein GF373_16870, partial [bacterium]|nr:hypothetical protein [bacterium]
MNALIQTLNNISPHWWDYIFHASWQSALIGLLLLALVWLGRKWSAPLRYGILLLALIKFLIPPMLSLPTGVLNYTPAPETINLTVQAPTQRPDLPFKSSFTSNEKANLNSRKPKNAESPPPADTKTTSIQQIPESGASPAPPI